MSWRDALRHTGAFWFLPLVLAVGVYGGLPDAVSDTDYAVADLANASFALVFVGPLVAGWTALRTRRFLVRVDLLAPVRSRGVVILAAWWPLLVAPGLVAIVAMIVAGGWAVPRDGASWAVVAVAAGTVVGCACLGGALSQVLPTTFAVPMSVAATFAWLAFPGSGTNVMLRQLNAGFVACCTSAQVPSPTMVRGSAAVAGTIIVALAVLMSLPPAPRAGVLVGIAAITAACALALGAGVAAVRASAAPTLLAVSARSTAQVCQGDASLRVCVWPENRDRIDDVARTLTRLNAAAERLGLPQTRRASENETTSGSTDFTAAANLTDRDLVYSSVDGYARWLQACLSGRPTDEGDGQVVAILGLSIGLSTEEARSMVDERAFDDASRAFGEGPTRAGELVRRELGLEGEAVVANTCRNPR